MVQVLGLGDNVCDIYLHTGMMYPGGQALNFAVYASQLGASADFMGVFGQDKIASHIKATLDAKNIGYTHCRTYEGENGFAKVTLVDGDRIFKGSNRGGVLQQHPIYLTEADRFYISKFDLVHTTNNGFTDSLLPTLYKLPPLISYDFSYRWNESDRVDRVCPYIDFAFLSCSDLDDKGVEDICRHLNSKGCPIIIATRGSKSAIAFDGAGFYSQVPELITPVDTMGAGDSFATALLVSLLQAIHSTGQKSLLDAAFRARTIPTALKLAASFSAKTCLTHGAFDYGMPLPQSLHNRIYDMG